MDTEEEASSKISSSRDEVEDKNATAVKPLNYDELEFFGKMVVARIRNFSRRSQAVACNIIQGLLFIREEREMDETPRLVQSIDPIPKDYDVLEFFGKTAVAQIRNFSRRSQAEARRTIQNFLCSLEMHEMATWKCEIVEGGVSLDIPDGEGQTPLHWAAVRGRCEEAKLLIDRGCDLDPKDRGGRTPLLCAAFADRKEVVDLLIERGAQLNCIDINNFSLLHFASFCGWLDVVRIILERGGANLDAATESWGTPLMWAVRAGRKDVINLLLRAGADADRRDDVGGTALHLAAVFGRTQVVQALLEQEGLNLNPQDEDSRTPLHIASQQHHRDAVRLLLEAGADPNIKDRHGEAVLSMHLKVPVRWASPEYVRLLVQYGAFFEEPDLAWISQHHPLLKENFLKDAKLCTQSVINKFHRQSLPTLYENPYFAGKLPKIFKLELSAQQIDEVEKLVKCDMIRNTFCNVVQVRPMALSALCVLSLAALPRQA